MSDKLSERLLEIQMVLEDTFDLKTSLSWRELDTLIAKLNEVRQTLKRNGL
ncbi:hypothetical protein [Sutcliffiella horikoshii]|uniref:hypothetical protein n=1 Tax=Sutcliffiella horikoshii TaxID=79883 RepID=UPI003CF4B964